MNVHSRYRTAALIAATILPWPVKRFVYRRVFGWVIEPGVRVGLCIITAHHVHLGRNSSIGHFTVVRNLPELILGENALIGQWNWITCGSFFTDGTATIKPPDQQGLFMAPNSAMTSRHYVDCPGGVFVEEYAVVGGVRSTLMTHALDVMDSNVICAPIRVGAYTYVASNVKIAPGGVVPASSIIGMGSVVVKGLRVPRTLYAGCPAKAIREIDDADFFRRLDPRAH